MRIALVHSYYSSRQPSGENVVVDAQAAALAEAGHEVRVVARRTDVEERRSLHSVRAAWTVATGVGADPTDELRAFRPDVVHVHNLFPNFGTSWLARWDGPVVATLHNFRPMCAAGTLQRDGATCTLCPDGDPLAALKHACYRESRAATLPPVAAHRGGLLTDPVVHRADALVVLTESAAGIYRKYGVVRRRLHVVPNFVDAPALAEKGAGRARTPSPAGSTSAGCPRRRASRSSSRSGRGTCGSTCTATVRSPDGSLASPDPTSTTSARSTAPSCVAGCRRTPGWSCQADGSKVCRPCCWRRYAAGLPCVAVAGSGAADVVAREGGGAVMSQDASTEDWSTVLAAVESTRPSLSRAARSVYDSRFTRGHWLESIGSVYAELATIPHPQAGALR